MTDYLKAFEIGLNEAESVFYSDYRLYSFTASALKTDENVVITPGYTFASSEEHARLEAMSYALKRWPEYNDHLVEVVKIPDNYVVYASKIISPTVSHESNSTEKEIYKLREIYNKQISIRSAIINLLVIAIMILMGIKL